MARPVLVVKSGGAEAMPEWQALFAALAPQLEVRWWGDAALDPASVRYALVWDPDPGRLAGMPNLEVIFSTGAGVDGITADPHRPAHLPVVRMVTQGAAQRMGEFVTWAVLSLLKGARRITANQGAARWEYFEPDHAAPEVPVGIMGMGQMGMAAARMLLGIGFPVRGWTRTPKDVPGVEGFVGPEGLDAFLAGTRILVCLLPATPETRGILNAGLIGRLPRGAGLVNVGRGSHQRIEDILAALDSGQLSGALLDVFEAEPLPPAHPAWAHPRLMVTPHLASLPARRERAAHVARIIAGHQRGEPLPFLFDPARGY